MGSPTYHPCMYHFYPNSSLNVALLPGREQDKQFLAVGMIQFGIHLTFYLRGLCVGALAPWPRLNV